MIDISMPRDVRARRKSIGYAAVTVLGMEGEPNAYRIGAAENVEALISDLQPGTWHPLFFERLIWTPGLPVARTIVSAAERFLTDTEHALGNRWYRVPIDVIDGLFDAEAIKLRARIWSHEELTQKLRRQLNEEADRFANGIF